MNNVDRPEPLTRLLREKISVCGLDFMTLSKATGVQRMSLVRFAKGDQSLRLDKADALAEYFGLELREKGRG